MLGKIACADMEQSELIGTSGDSEMIDVDFESLVIDESKTHAALLFRLAENVFAIIVYEKVADFVEAKAIPCIRFLLPENWSG